MDDNCYELASQFMDSRTYMEIAREGLHQQTKLFRALLAEKRLPKQGWSEATIESFLQYIAMMDSQNYLENVGVGEREGRVISQLVARRNYRLAHGVGRSGDLVEVQPKAAGSSLLYQLTNAIVLNLFHSLELKLIKSAIVVPCATGMTISLCLSSLRESRPHAKYVLWPRIDQKSCLKSIYLAGLKPLVIPNHLEKNCVKTDILELEKHLASAVLLREITIGTAISVPLKFSIVEVAELCQKYDLPHLINNAYGLQDSKCTSLIGNAMKSGRIDLIVQSTDKNFLVPVGGAIIASGDKNRIELVSRIYPGRASMSPILDLFITLVGLGSQGYLNMRKERKILYSLFATKLEAIAKEFGEEVICPPQNKISIAFSLKILVGKDPTRFGAWLFRRAISGVRVIDPSNSKEVCGMNFRSYGAHADGYPFPYLTVAAAIGATEAEINLFCSRFQKTFRDYLNSSKAVEESLL